MLKRLLFCVALAAGCACGEDVTFTVEMIRPAFWPRGLPTVAVTATVPPGADDIQITLGYSVNVPPMVNEITKTAGGACSVNGHSTVDSACFQPWLDAEAGSLQIRFVNVSVRRGAETSSKRIQYADPLRFSGAERVE